MTNQHLDDALDRLHRTGPEFDGWLSNHGPMAADALLRLGRGDLVARWVAGYERRLEEAPAPRWPIDPTQWREPLGDPTRLGDWCALLLREVHEEPWAQVLERWWPRLLPGALASAAHGLIRTGHAVRALREEVTGPRLDELALALAYWAGRWQPLPDGGLPAAARAGGRVEAPATDVSGLFAARLGGHIDADRDDLADAWRGSMDHRRKRVLAALDGVPRVADQGGIRTRAAALTRQPGWPASRHALTAPLYPADVPTALDVVVDAAVTRYSEWAHADPIMLVHAATAPRAAGLVLPSLPVAMWGPTFEVAWGVTAAIASAYRPIDPDGSPPPNRGTVEQALDACVQTGDEHAIKFAEVASESAARGNPASARSAARAAALMSG